MVKHGHHNLLFYCVTVELKYLSLRQKEQLQPTSAVCRFSKYSLVHKCRNESRSCTLYSKRIYLTRSLSIAAIKTVDCSFIKAEHSTQLKFLRKITLEKILVLPNNSPYNPPVSQSFHLPFVEQSQVLAQCITKD
jgi:hypothetical protein